MNRGQSRLDRNDHEHLDKLLTYAVGLDERIVVWIAKEFSSERRSARDVLNPNTSHEHAFFGVSIDLLTIDGSRLALRFTNSVRPNAWTKAVGRLTSLRLKRCSSTYQPPFGRWLIPTALSHALGHWRAGNWMTAQ